MDDIVRDFLIESNENLDRLDQELVKLESEPSSTRLLGSIFRTIHSIKGSCGFLGFARLERVAHAESLLSRLRDGVLSLTAEMTTGLLAMVDAVRRMLAEIQTSERDGENDYAELLEKLRQLQQAESTGGQARVRRAFAFGFRRGTNWHCVRRGGRSHRPVARSGRRPPHSPARIWKNSEGCWSSAGT